MYLIDWYVVYGVGGKVGEGDNEDGGQGKYNQGFGIDLCCEIEIKGIVNCIGLD